MITFRAPAKVQAQIQALAEEHHQQVGVLWGYVVHHGLARLRKLLDEVQQRKAMYEAGTRPEAEVPQSPSRREHLRAMVWPRQTAMHPSTAVDAEGRPVYRYAIIGLLVTDQPLNVPDEFMVDGSAGALGYTLETLPKYAPSRRPGDAVDVLCDLDGLLGARMDTGTVKS